MCYQVLKTICSDQRIQKYKVGGVSGPVEHKGKVGIHPNNLSGATLTIFQPVGADYAHYIRKTQPTSISFHRACPIHPPRSLEYGHLASYLLEHPPQSGRN